MKRRCMASLPPLMWLALTLLATFLVGMTVPAVAQTAQPDGEDAVLTLARQLTAWMVEGRFDQVVARFSPAIAGMLSAEELGAVWASLPLQVGALQEVGEPWLAAAEPAPIVRTPLRFEYMTLDVVYGFDAGLMLSSLVFVPHEPRPQASAEPAPFVEYELTFGVPGFPLTGTLTLPRGDGPFPAVVLVHGSGANDRDETVGPNKPFRDLAWGLAQRGIAVFRYDKRTLVHGLVMAQNPEMTVDDETIIDAAEAVRLLRGRDDIGKMYVVGHSLGGMLAPYIALEEPSIDGLVLLAANARGLGELTVAQIDYLLSGYATPGTEPLLAAMRPEAERIASGDFDGVDVLLGVPVHYWIDLESRDHVGVAQRLTQPMLILQGERDYQVTVTDFAMWQEALAGKDNVTFRLYPGLNHLFLRGEGPGTPLEYMMSGTVAQEVIDDIAEWIRAQQ